MKNMISKTLLLLLLSIVMFSGAIYSQQRPGIKPDLPRPDFSPPIPVTSPVDSCDAQLNRLFSSAPAWLNSGNDLTALTNQIAQFGRLLEPEKLLVLRLENNKQPAFLVAYSCHANLTELKAEFQIFKATGGHYTVAARSRDFAVLGTEDAEQYRADDASLEVHVLPGQAGQPILFETTFTRGGGTPAEFSVAVWSWNGVTLNNVFERLFLRAGGIQIVGSVLVITDTNHDANTSSEVYELRDNRVLFSGTLSKLSLEREETRGELNPRSSQEMNTLGALWESVGDPGRAILAYTHSVTLDNSSDNRYIYLQLSELYEQTGQNVAAVSTLERYQTSLGASVSPEMKNQLQEKIQKLRDAAH